MAEPHVWAPYERGPGAKRAALRAALRAAASREVAAHGLARLNLHRLAEDAGMKFDIARHHYRTNAALLIDVVREFHAALGERMADAVLAARALPGGARVRALAEALMQAMAAERAGALTARAACAALPEVAAATRHGEAWLVGELADALNAAGVAEAALRARMLVWVVGEWACRGEGETERVVEVVCGALTRPGVAGPTSPKGRGGRCAGVRRVRLV